MDELPDDLLAAAETLTRRARRAVDDDEAAAYRERRERLLREHDFTARVREEENRDVLVCHPAEWLDDGVVQMDRIEDIDRAAEIPLSGPGDPDEWDAVDEANREVVAAVRETHGDVHGDNAAAFADFMGNHYAKPIERATPEEVTEFVEDYFVRNVWPSDEQAAVVEDSVERTLELAEE
jgi:hypothetical protein